MPPPLKDSVGAEGGVASVEDARRLVIETVTALKDSHLSVSWGDRLLTIDKSAGFMQDSNFMRSFDQIRGSQQYDQYDGADTIAWRLNTLVWAGRCAVQVGGIS